MDTGWMIMIITALIFFITTLHSWCDASIGDRLIVFQNHFITCLRRHCENLDALNEFESSQQWYLRALGWHCEAECKYRSQWRTIQQLREHNVEIIPQFYGKWTFYRVWGIQEPASFVFSLANFATNIIGWWKYRQRVMTTTGPCDPMYVIWLTQTLLSANAWFCSTVYHAKETSFSERLDYFSAYAVVIFSLFAVIAKLIDSINLSTTSSLLSIAIPILAFYLYHVHYLHWVHFDYGYNMRVNVATGLASTILWLYWCYRQFKMSRKLPHVWKCATSVLLLNACLLLELVDFAPLVYVFDAHSLWHLATIPIPLLWYSFLADEASIHIIQVDSTTTTTIDGRLNKIDTLNKIHHLCDEGEEKNEKKKLV